VPQDEDAPDGPDRFDGVGELAAGEDKCEAEDELICLGGLGDAGGVLESVCTEKNLPLALVPENRSHKLGEHPKTQSKEVFWRMVVF
jgi:hypothetical protein